jgi:branched-chain amino acid transport system ATP-binding protein
MSVLPAKPLLSVEHVDARYGGTQALFNVSLRLDEGQIVSLLGRNGMGKSTIVKTIMGVLSPAAGSIRFAGSLISNSPSHEIARRGIGLVPEGRRIIPALTVEENLLAFAANRLKRIKPWTLERVYALFPRLQERSRSLAGTLSGGEQQMLAIGRALSTNPRLVILDEATEGLSPLARKEIWQALAALKAQGLSILIIDKQLKPLLSLSDYHFIIEKGRIVWSGSSQEFRDDQARLQPFLSL